MDPEWRWTSYWKWWFSSNRYVIDYRSVFVGFHISYGTLDPLGLWLLMIGSPMGWEFWVCEKFGPLQNTAETRVPGSNFVCFLVRWVKFSTKNTIHQHLPTGGVWTLRDGELTPFRNHLAHLLEGAGMHLWYVSLFESTLGLFGMVSHFLCFWFSKQSCKNHFAILCQLYFLVTRDTKKLASAISIFKYVSYRNPGWL